MAVFVDGPHHDEPTRRQKDKEQRQKLEARGYRMIAIRYDEILKDQVIANVDVFGPGIISVGEPHQMSPSLCT